MRPRSWRSFLLDRGNSPSIETGRISFRLGEKAGEYTASARSEMMICFVGVPQQHGC